MYDYDDDRPSRAQIEAEESTDRFNDWLREQDIDPDTVTDDELSDLRYEFDDGEAYAKDPYAYNGLSRSDFY